jgi:glyoxylase-like metal-dependent hydrolase (beta-lactamase superfamily II)
LRRFSLLIGSGLIVLLLILRPEPSSTSECLRFSRLNRICVPLPNQNKQVIEVGPDELCDKDFFSTEEIDVRKLFDDTILLKETGDPTGEKPVMVLFLGQSKALLLDAGNNSTHIEDVVRPLVNTRSLELINTHLHGDHIGRNDKFQVIAIETPSIDAHCQLTSEDFDDNQAATCKNQQLYRPPQDQMLFSPRSFQVVRVVREGHKLDLGNGRLITILATPGHSETSISLFDPTHQLLFTGDTLYPGSNPPLVHPGVGSSFAAYLATAERYKAFASQVRLVIGAHGEGLMPGRSLEAFFALVRARFDDPDNSADFIDDVEQCPAGDFVMGNDPKR